MQTVFQVKVFWQENWLKRESYGGGAPTIEDLPILADRQDRNASLWRNPNQEASH